MPDDIAFSTRFPTRCKSKLFRHMIFIRLKEAARSSYAALESRLSVLDWHLTHPAYREFVHLFFGYYELLGEKIDERCRFLLCTACKCAPRQAGE